MHLKRSTLLCNWQNLQLVEGGLLYSRSRLGQDNPNQVWFKLVQRSSEGSKLNVKVMTDDRRQVIAKAHMAFCQVS